MNLSKRRQHSSGVLVTILLFGIFTICAVFLVVIGSSIYSKINADMEQNNAVRSSFSYVTNKVRSFNATGNISVEKGSQGDILVLEKMISGEAYLNRIYLCDGILMESFLQATMEFEDNALAGEKIVPVESFRVSMEGTLLKVTIQCPGYEERTISISPRVKGKDGGVA